jgi:glyoxylase-like metal-dependent hydrolase (beta-lactamase superfamily II)
MTYSVQALKMAEAEVPGPEVYWMSHWNEWVKLHFYMVVLRGNGITAIINTGPPSDISQLNSAWSAFAGPRCQMIRSEQERPERALAAIGVNPADVDYVLLTPLQSYATANIPMFAKAKICLSRRGWIDDVIARPNSSHGSRDFFIPDAVLKYLLFEAQHRVHLLEDEEEVCPGIRAWWAGVHHRSSMVYSVDTDAGVVMIGDCAMMYENLVGPPLGIAESLLEAATAYQRIQRESSIFLPLYDPNVLVRYPNGIIASTGGRNRLA